MHLQPPNPTDSAQVTCWGKLVSPARPIGDLSKEREKGGGEGSEEGARYATRLRLYQRAFTILPLSVRGPTRPSQTQGILDS